MDHSFIAASIPKLSSYTRDITQAYAQSCTALEREMSLRPPAEMNFAPDSVLKVIRPSYGIQESGIYWYLTYGGHHINNISMVPSRADHCLLFERRCRTLSAFLIVHGDDSTIVGS